MTEPMIVEAIRATATTGVNEPLSAPSVASAAAVADPSAVTRFNAVMAADPIPFASEVSATFRTSQADNQEILHRIKTLCEMSSHGSVASAELLELQYDVMNLAFQQEVVTKVADKASSAIQTLIKNQ